MPPPFRAVRKLIRFFWWRHIADDRRRYPRLKTHNLIRYYYPIEENQERVSNLIDLSPEGFRFFFNGKELHTGEAFRVAINFNAGDREIETLAIVCWHKKNGGRNSHYVGAVFKNLSAEDRHFINHYLLKRHKNLLLSWLFSFTILQSLR